MTSVTGLVMSMLSSGLVQLHINRMPECPTHFFIKINLLEVELNTVRLSKQFLHKIGGWWWWSLT